MLHRPVESGQYTSIRFGERLAAAGIRPSVGAVGSSYDNALAETINGLFKTELIRPRGPWRTVDHVELATAEWVDWFNHRRLYEYCGDIPPAALEAAYYSHNRAQHPAEALKPMSLRTPRGGSHHSRGLDRRQQDSLFDGGKVDVVSRAADGVVSCVPDSGVAPVATLS